jgi:hypothetical protein
VTTGETASGSGKGLAKPPEGAVVPATTAGEITDTTVEEFRQSVLSNPFWKTGLGGAFLGWFWANWLGHWLTRKFGPTATPPGTPQELHGYAYWGPVALFITIVEILGALSKSFRNFIPWPTISGTVGHIEDLDGRWGLAVVFVIAVTAFAAMSSTKEAGKSGSKALFLGIRYGWPLVLVVTGLTALFVRILDGETDDQLRKYHLGYAIYAAFAVIGILVPIFLIWRGSDRVVFPSLWFTFGILRTRFRWIAGAVVAGLAILVIHLALYPWPNLAREPAKYAGLNGYRARAEAEKTLRADPNAKPNLVYSTEGRAISKGHNVWLVYFNEWFGKNSTFNGCVVEVTEAAQIPDAACRHA